MPTKNSERKPPVTCKHKDAGRRQHGREGYGKKPNRLSCMIQVSASSPYFIHDQFYRLRWDASVAQDPAGPHLT